MKQKFLLLGLVVIFLSSFTVFTIIAKFDLLTQLDFNTTVKIQNHISVRLDPFFSLVGLLARFDVVLILLLVLFVRWKNKLTALAIITFYGLAHAVELIGKLYLDHPGPPFLFYRYDKTFLFPDLYVVGSSYPSGHSLRAMFIAVLLSYICLIYFKKNAARVSVILGFIWLTAISIAFGKIVLGQHWTSDVIGGVLLGLAFGFFSIFAVNYRKHSS